MPQASDELYALYKFVTNQDDGDSVPGEQFLKSRGYILLKDWTWRMPSKDHFISDYEMICLRFLVEEWDWGGIAEEEADASPLP